MFTGCALMAMHVAYMSPIVIQGIGPHMILYTKLMSKHALLLHVGTPQWHVTLLSLLSIASTTSRCVLHVTGKWTVLVSKIGGHESIICCHTGLYHIDTDGTVLSCLIGKIIKDNVKAGVGLLPFHGIMASRWNWN